MMSEINSLLSLEEILEAVNGYSLLDKTECFFTTVATDSRQVQKDTLFVPLIGEVQDGHKYIEPSLEKGASVVFVRKENFESDREKYFAFAEKYTDAVFVIVENTLAALQKAAGRYVEKFPSLIKIGVTGSSGKTTTKEIALSILSQKYNVVANEGNFNSETGLPLSVFKIRCVHEAGLFEMGMNRVDEIKEIAGVLKPEYAVITNIGTAHIGILGSRENIAKEKGNILDYIDENGTAVIPQNDDFAEYLASRVKGNVVYYGKESESSAVKFIEDKGLEGTLFSVGGIECTLPLPGIYNFYNACGAITLASVLGVSNEQIVEGIKSMKTLFGRSEVLKGKYTIVQDCYNANPDSMEKALEFVDSVNTNQKRIYVLGDMLELGSDSENAHSSVGKAVAGGNADLVIFVGTEMKYAYDAAVKNNCKAECVYLEDKADESIEKACEKINSFASEKDIVLVKGSRGIGLERLTKLLMKQEEGNG